MLKEKQGPGQVHREFCNFFLRLYGDQKRTQSSGTSWLLAVEEGGVPGMVFLREHGAPSGLLKPATGEALVLEFPWRRELPKAGAKLQSPTLESYPSSNPDSVTYYCASWAKSFHFSENPAPHL